MDKIYLIPNTEQHKANLHCHTNLSDGRLTPEEMCEGYKKHGYRVMAFSDHEYLTHHPEFNSEDFIAITAYEIGLYTPELPGSWEDTWRDRKCCHLNLYAKNPNEDTHIMFDPDAVPNCVKPIKNSFKHKGEICAVLPEDIASGEYEIQLGLKSDKFTAYFCTDAEYDGDFCKVGRIVIG